ncbi:DUF2326 domain-containing protein [Leptospira kanakyensis]|uniref:DUF2326 domain-containing protein n=1 Tax=Leptospira kanakyensis TaxID=2484968 RepID=A0A6N4PZN5_9LEPT|nr:DUF2326 domain-containing protein [Leptospira kanakyensis]TGK50461.1 DUF2326 domain-containing protein [Leptospira kanakyensis]TGK63938.1 DUF2326 domain-containing protein [Leptospira kanakyensis]TGK69599.1 DUF2326 domain-containing protein [Leptospira kanakyensis]
MFLKSLIIQNGFTIIREIKFKKGINLIIDETKNNSKTSSGNNVGKTTVLRLIDFCLDGNGENIYKDPEFNKNNIAVENFIKQENVSIKLTLIEDIGDSFSKTFTIERNFKKAKDRIQKINGIDYKNTEFSTKLKELIFRTDSRLPTLRQLISKNIRDEKNKLINTIRVLAPNVITDVTYETLHLFWFGIDINLSKDQFIRERNLELKIQARLKKDSNLPQINQALLIANKRIDELIALKKKFDVNEDFENELVLLNKVRKEINLLISGISRLEIRKELIQESKKDLESNKANIDLEEIKNLYARAKVLIPNLQKNFSDVLVFHNGMVEKKIQFITEELPSIESELKKNQQNLKELLQTEKRLSDIISKSNTYEDFQKVIDELNIFYERKGVLEEQKRSWELSIQNIKTIDTKIEAINREITSKDELIQKRIAEFNSIFSEISSRLDGVHSLLSADNSEGVYKFSMSNVEGNPGTGSKKSQMASFDLAYIKFADSIDLPCLHFVLQDQIENVHSNQITNLLTEIVEEVNCQYVLPVLRDKLPKDIEIQTMEILSLSENDKLFKI